MKSVTDIRGAVFSLDKVVAVLKGGTPHTELGLPREEVAVLVYESGAKLEVLAPFSKVLAAWSAGSAAPAPGMIDAPAGVADAEVLERSL